MAGSALGIGTAVVAGDRYVRSRAKVREFDTRAGALLRRDLSDPVARALRDSRVQLLRFEQAVPLRAAHRAGTAAVAGALLAVASLSGGIGFSLAVG